MLAAAMFVVSALGTAISLWGRWLATRTTKRVQVTVRRKVFEHAVRLPLHRVYQLKSGGAASLLREDAGGVGELIFSMLYNPWRAVVQLVGRLVVLAWVDWRCLLGSLLLVPAVCGSDRLWNRRHPPALSRHPQAAPGDRRHDDRGLRRDAGGPRLRPTATESARFIGENHFMARPGDLRLVVDADHRGRSGNLAARRLGPAAALRRPRRCSAAGSRWAT